MPALVLDFISVGLFLLLIGSTLGAIISLARAEYMPRSAASQRLIEHEREIEPPLTYSPASELLSERGRALRRRGVRLAQLAAITLALYVAFYYAVGPR